MNDMTAIVTGSARGIGMGIAKKLLRQGYTVLLSDVRPAEEGIGILKPLADEGLTACEYLKCDISLPDDRDALFQYMISRYGRLDVLVNNAGISPLVRADLLEMSAESLNRLIEVNLKGTFFMCQQAAKIMLQRKSTADIGPRIINISSISAYTSSVNRGEYCISKAGVAMTTQLFADRLAEEGIRVFEVRPGIIMTDMTEAVKEKYEVMIREGITPVKRFGQPGDVADMVYAACTGLMDFTTGQVLNADGGFHLRRL